MNQVKTILDITKKDGEQFKRWVHSVAAAATLNGNAKTGSQFLRGVYNELINNDELPNISKIGFLIHGGNNKLNYLANYKPNTAFTFDFIMFKEVLNEIIKHFNMVNNKKNKKPTNKKECKNHVEN